MKKINKNQIRLPAVDKQIIINNFKTLNNNKDQLKNITKK